MIQRSSLIVLAVLPACLPHVIALEPRAESVQIVRETNKPLHCEVRGKITGTSRSSDPKEARTGAENDFRNQAAELKANFALIEAERGGAVGTGTQHDAFLGGKALFCQTEEMEEAKEKADAAAREAKEKPGNEPRPEDSETGPASEQKAPAAKGKS